MGRASRRTTNRSSDEDDFPPVEMARVDDPIDDDPNEDDAQEDDRRWGALRRAQRRAQSGSFGRTPTRYLIIDWADFEFVGSDDSYNSVWR